MSVTNVKNGDEYEELKSRGLVVVDFYTTWCGPCIKFAPEFEQMAKDFPGITFLKVDAEAIEHEDCENIKSVPTFKIFLNGLLKREFSGVDKEKILRYIERYEVQILINGRTQREFPEDIVHKVTTYMKKIRDE